MTSQPLGSVPGSLIDWAAGVIGISPAIVRAQISDESGGNPNSVSPTGAQGVAQFEPGTWQSEGCAGSPFNVNDAMKCYARYMYQLVQQFHGNVRDALAAYNAGPGNLPAGYGYADKILAAAGQPQSVTAQGGTGAAGSAPSTGGASGNPAECALSLGGQHIGILFGRGPTLPSACLIRKTEVRAMLGALVLVGGGLVALPGLVIMLAYAFRASGAAAAVTQAAGAVPGYGRVVRRASGAARKRAAPAKRAPARPREPSARSQQQRLLRARRAEQQRRRPEVHHEPRRQRQAPDLGELREMEPPPEP